METITTNYKILQRQVHPDRIGIRPASEKLWAQMHAATLNEAFTTLTDDVARGGYLLQQAGITARHTTDNKAILLESLERREALAAAVSVAELAVLDDAAAHAYADAYQAVAAAFAADDLAEAETALIRLRFLQKYRADIAERQHTMAEAG